MPLGKALQRIAPENTGALTRLGRRLYYQAWGIPELYSHIRWRAIRRFVDFDRKMMLEVGCGIGLMTFEIAQRARLSIIVGLDCCRQSVVQAQRLSALFHNCRFYVADVTSIPARDGIFDEVLCFDVLEHVPDDHRAMREISRVLKRDGILVISCPTPRFPKVFGHEFASAIGHVRDGYTLNQIESMCQQVGLQVMEHKHYTLSIGSRVCSLFYKNLHNHAMLQTILSPFLYTISLMDFVGEPANACSILVKARKQGQVRGC